MRFASTFAYLTCVLAFFIVDSACMSADRFGCGLDVSSLHSTGLNKLVALFIRFNVLFLVRVVALPRC